MRPGTVWWACASLLLGASGALTLAASAQRWWSACGLSGFDTDRCLTVQDHRYDYTPPADPWAPVGAAAELQGLALLVLAAALLVLPFALTGRRPGLLLSPMSWVVAGGVAVMGTVTWLSGAAAEPVALWGMWAGGLLWVLGVPALVVVATASARPASKRVWTGRWVVVACLAASNPIGNFFLAPLLHGYLSYDTAPWSEAVSGMLLTVAAAAVWTALPGRRAGEEESRLEPVQARST